MKKRVKSAVAVFIITSLDAREAAPVHLADHEGLTFEASRSAGSAAACFAGQRYRGEEAFVQGCRAWASGPRPFSMRTRPV